MHRPVHEVAREKLVRVFGERRAEHLLRTTLEEIGLARLHTPDDLLRFARALEPKGVMEKAVAAILDFQAALRGHPRP